MNTPSTDDGSLTVGALGGNPGAQTLINEILKRRQELIAPEKHGLPSECLCYFILDQFVDIPPDDRAALAALPQYLLRNRQELFGVTRLSN